MLINAEHPQILIHADEDGCRVITLTVDVSSENQETFLSNADFILASKSLSVDIDRSYPARSRNANAMFWALCSRIAAALGTTNDEMYLQLLERYGAANVVTVDEELADSMESVLEKEYKWIKRLGNIIIDSRPSVQFFCYKGSHAYNTAEMSRLIKGTIQDCQELGIPTDPPEVIQQAIDEWGADNHDSDFLTKEDLRRIDI